MSIRTLIAHVNPRGYPFRPSHAHQTAEVSSHTTLENLSLDAAAPHNLEPENEWGRAPGHSILIPMPSIRRRNGTRSRRIFAEHAAPPSYHRSTGSHHQSRRLCAAFEQPLHTHHHGVDAQILQVHDRRRVRYPHVQVVFISRSPVPVRVAAARRRRGSPLEGLSVTTTRGESASGSSAGAAPSMAPPIPSRASWHRECRLP